MKRKCLFWLIVLEVSDHETMVPFAFGPVARQQIMVENVIEPDAHIVTARKESKKE
jgi:hypothetical protein